MIAVDTNILVYAHREDSPWFDKAYSHLIPSCNQNDTMI
jgi:predicted nucleic acid-binding protein